MVFEFEAGSAFSSYNDIRIPGDLGSLFSPQADLNPNASIYLRFCAGWEFTKDHAISLLIAPLRLDASGISTKAISFAGKNFAAGEMLEARYRFDSYRLVYRYTLIDAPTFQLKLGLTAMLRDAAISIRGDFGESEKKNSGFLPLVNFSLHWFLGGGLSLLIDGDALVWSQGRAEDILIGVRYDLNGKYFFRAGWRLLEGGVDKKEVYSFAWINHISLAGGIRL